MIMFEHGGDCGAPGATKAGAMHRAAPTRRMLAILFADLCGSTAIANRMEAEEYDEVLAAVRDRYEAIVPRHGGVVAQVSGDGMLAIFGHDGARESDSTRAVEAALDLHREVRALAVPVSGGPVRLRLHSGVHAGLVLLRRGDAVGGRYELPGAATNVAARLRDAAGDDEILVSDAALGPERHCFEFTRRAILVKGRKAPLPALSITGRATVRSRYAASIRQGLTPFVGRAQERIRLTQAHGRADGRVEVVAVTGPAGLGKTRLANEFLETVTLTGHEVLRGECAADGAALLPFLQVADAAESLLPAPPEGVEARIVAAAAHSRLVLFFDDWHLADDASRNLLARLSTRDDLAMLVLLTVRTPAPPVAAEIIELAPLEGGEADAFVHARLPAADPMLVETLQTASGGNPLFIEELCHSIAAGRHAEAPVPASSWIDTLIESRLRRLHPDDVALLRAASVLGTGVDRQLLSAICPTPADPQRIARLAEYDLLFPGERAGMLRFKHGITRDAVYNAIGLYERRRLHLAAAQALLGLHPDPNDPEPVEVLALHFAQGGDNVAAAVYAERAGDRALALSALDRAQAHYHTALDALDRLPASPENAIRWSRIAQRYGRAGVFDPSQDQLAVFRRAVERAETAGDTAAGAWAKFWVGLIEYGLGRAMAAVPEIREALATAVAAEDQTLASQARALLGQSYLAAGQYETGLALLDVTLSERQAQPSGRPSASLAYALSCKAFALADLARFDEADACFDEALAAAQGAMREIQLSVVTQRAAACLWQFRFDEARALAAEGERLSQLIGSRYSLTMSRAMAAYARWASDPAYDPMAVLTDSLGWLAGNGRNQFVSLLYGWCADVSAHAGGLTETRRYAAGALGRALRHDPLGEAMACRALARIAATGGTRRPAGYWLGRADAAAQRRGALHDRAVNGWLRAALTPIAANDAPDSPQQALAAMRALGMHPEAAVRLVRQPVPARSA